MADDSLILEHLRAIRSAQARHDEKFQEVITRLGAIERDLAAMKVDFASMQVRLDRHDARLDRIERRLELVNGTAQS
jgi:tetrahydromethanopterin S-methyltransferase subunit G